MQRKKLQPELRNPGNNHSHTGIVLTTVALSNGHVRSWETGHLFAWAETVLNANRLAAFCDLPTR